MTLRAKALLAMPLGTIVGLIGINVEGEFYA